MKYLVTGGSGFIGTNVVNRLLDLNNNVLNLDVLEPLKDKHFNFFKNCDIRDVDSLRNIVNEFQPDFVIHLAARTDLDGKELSDYSSNIEGVENICLICSEVKSIKKVLFASSMLVCHGGYIPVSIDDFQPTTLYGQSKVIGEKIVRSKCSILPDFVIARPTSIWGPWFRTPYKDFFDIVLAHKFIDVGSKLSTKTYGFIDNAVNQILSLVATETDNKNDIVYIGDETPIEIRQWAIDICSQARIKAPLKVPFIALKVLAKIGDFAKFFGLTFPMTSFRLKNMTTSNILDCALATKTNKYEMVSYSDGISKTLIWIKDDKVNQ